MSERFVFCVVLQSFPTRLSYVFLDSTNDFQWLSYEVLAAAIPETYTALQVDLMSALFSDITFLSLCPKFQNG